MYDQTIFKCLRCGTQVSEYGLRIQMLPDHCEILKRACDYPETAINSVHI